MSQTSYSDTRKRLNDILRFAVDSKYSNFYQDKYQTTRTRNVGVEGFRELPLLGKQEILNTPLSKRIFLPENELAGYSVTSGTAKEKKLLVVPFSHVSESFHKEVLKDKRIKKFGLSKIIFLTSPLHGMVRHLIYSPKAPLPFTLGKIDDFNLCVQIIKDAEINGVISTPTILDQFIPALKRERLAKKIRWVCLAGEHCSKQRLEILKKELPEAIFDVIYGSTEAGVMGIRCDHKKKRDPNIYHPVKELFFEILDEKGNPQKEGLPGEIVVTTLRKTAFPLIRYKIGDMGILKKTNCKCGNKYELEVLGRSQFDSIKVQGTIIHAKSLENALTHVSDLVYPDFHLTVSEKKQKGKVMPSLNLKLIPRDRIIFDIDKLNNKLAEKISENFWLSSKSTLKDLIEKGVYLPIDIKLVSEIKKTLNKAKTIEYRPT